MSGSSKVLYSQKGYCPICETEVEFSARALWFRDHLFCSGCGSIPRERALALVLSRYRPDWRNLMIHESSPGSRGISPKLKLECANYVASQFFPGQPLGKTVKGFRNEDLENQTFPDRSFHLVVTLDVMEHVNQPEMVFKEVARTLRLRGSYIFTVPTYKGKIESERRSLYKPDGSIEHYVDPPEYHGNPISDQGSLVTFHYGHDLPELIHKWSGMNVEVIRFHDHHHGIIGDFTEVYVCRPADPSAH